MKFFLIDRRAVESIIQDRKLQSVEFSGGAVLADLLAGNSETERVGSTFSIKHNDGLYLLAPEPDLSRCLIFDIERCPTIWERDASDRLLVFQKTLRFAIKLWDGLRLGPAEHNVGETKAVLFPFNYGSTSQFRLTLERIKRSTDQPGQHLFVFRCGRDVGGGVTEMAPLGSYNLAMTALSGAVAGLRVSLDQRALAPVAVVGVTELDGVIESQLPIAMPFENWFPFLSDVQKEFVTRPVLGPERLEGPAGTGKTLSLMLRCIFNLRDARARGLEHHSIFITHSEATRRSVEERFTILDPDGFATLGRNASPQSVTISTLQEWCAAQLGQGLSEVEFLDRDASESKALQHLYVSEALDEVLDQHLASHRPFLSDAFKQFLATEERWHIAEMIQHEIAVMIKGRAHEDLEMYKRLPPLKYNLPLDNENDRGFVYLVYLGYQRRLQDTAQFDTDDIVVSAIQQLDTPIWRRRRRTEGFHSIFIDETHLFNINELSALHYLSLEDSAAPIVYSIDRAQAVGDRGLRASFENSFLPETDETLRSTVMRAVFRCSPDIVNLAFAITATGATLFTNFENPLALAASTFTREEERLCEFPLYRRVAHDEAIVTEAFTVAEQMAEDLPGGRSGVAIVEFSPELLSRLENSARVKNRPVEVLKRRGDVEVVNRARSTGRFVLAGPEYVGGLEFEGVVLVGVDRGRVPPLGDRATVEAQHFLRYAAHNLLYVSVTRAKYRVVLLGTIERGLSDVLKSAVDAKLLEL